MRNLLTKTCAKTGLNLIVLFASFLSQVQPLKMTDSIYLSVYLVLNNDYLLFFWNDKQVDILY